VSAPVVPGLVTIGETMVVLVPTGRGPLSAADTLSIGVGGAESNVAGFLADLGFRTRWAGIVGDDPFGEVVVTRLAERDIDLSSATRMAGQRTGFYIKELPDAVELASGGQTRVRYARAGSAATFLSPARLQDERLARSPVLHLTGITPALSASARDMVWAAATGPRAPDRIVSFDVNFRPLLWSAHSAGPELASLADRCDLVFTGLDEARALWGCESVADIRELLPGAGTIVVKDGAVGAYSLPREGEPEFVPALRVRVVEDVGAGDAFAAGYLGGRFPGVSA
jgi:2-dehydro-3-deoxygluconokinase